MAEKRKADSEQAAQKKVKIDENDIDFLIGDLLKEEAQLVLTRLLRLPGLEDELRKNIEIVRHARTKLTDQQIKQQLFQIEQLRSLQAAAASGAGFNFTPTGFGSLPGMGMGMGGPSKPGLDPSVLRSIKAKIRDAFKKEGSSGSGRGVVETYRVEEGILQGELSNAKEKADRGGLRQALEILQAITEEFIERSSHFEEANIRNYAPVLEQIGRAWIEVFLGESLDGESELTPEDRDTWAEKLRSWNKSAEEESILNASRWAAKLGWEDERLKKVLSGQATAEAAEFKEPQRLSNERLLILERGKHLKEALNLAKGLSLHFQVARFLMKLNQPKEGVEAAMRLMNAAEVASIAQIARPIDLESAFSLAIFCLSLQDQSKNAEMSNWLVDLCISENKLNDLVEKLPTVVKNKNTQMQVIRMLKTKAQAQAALSLSRKTLKPYTNDELVALWNLEHGSQTLRSAQTRSDLLRAVTGSDVPQELCLFIWETAYEADLVSPPSSPTTLANEYLEICLQMVDQVHQLQQLMGALDSRKLLSQLLRVGQVALEKSQAQEKFDLDFRRENAIAKFKHDQERLAAEARGVVVPAFVPKPVDHPLYGFLDFQVRVCRTMFTSILSTKAAQNRIMAQLAAGVAVSDEEKKLSEKRIAECNTFLEEVTETSLAMIPNPADLITLANELVNHLEYRLALKIGQKAFSQVEQLDKERAVRDAITQNYRTLRSESDLLTSQKLTLNAQKAEELKDLSLQVTLFTLLPAHVCQGARAFEELFQQIATFNINAAISSQASLELPQRLSPEEIATIVDHSLQFVRNPSNIASLVQLCRNKSEFALVQKIGQLALTRISELRARLVQRLAIQAELGLLQQDQLTLSAQKRELTPEQKARLDELLEAQRPLAPAFYELGTCDAYEAMEYSILENLTTSSVQERSHLQATLDALPAEAPAERRTRLQADLAQAEAQIGEVFAECLTRLRSPRHAHSFAAALRNLGGQIDLVLRATEHGQACLPPLIAQALTRWDLRRNLQELQAEAQELAEQRPPQALPADRQQELFELRLQVALWDAEASFQNQTPIQSEQLALELSTLMLQALQARLEACLSRVEALATSLLARAPVGASEAALAAHQASQQAGRAEKARLEAEIASLATKKQQCVRHCLSVLTSPQHVGAFTRAVTLTDEASLELLTAAGKRTLAQVDLLDDDRFQHAGILERIQLIEQEAELLEKFRKRLPDDRAAELRALRREDARWGFTTSRLAAIPLSDMKRELAIAVLSALLAHRRELEASIKALRANPDHATIPAELRSPNRDLEALEYRLRKTQEAIDLFLTEALQFIQSPYDINALCALFPSTIPPLYKLVRTGFTNTIELNKIYEERSPVYAEIRRLEAEAQELSNVNKQLKKNELDRLAELKHQVFLWDQGAPHKRVRPETREGFKLKMLQTLERALVDVKEELKGRLSAVEDEKRTEDAQDKMQVDAAGGARDLQKEIADLKEQLRQHADTMRRYINEFVAELQDPNHFLELCQSLKLDEEPDLLIQVAKVGHKLIRDLDTRRQEHAVIFRTYFLLLSELYQEKGNNALLHPTRQQKLKEAQAQAEAVIPVKYVIHSSSSSSSSSSSRGGGGGFRGKKAPLHHHSSSSSSSGGTYPTPEDLAKAAALVDSKDVKFNEQPTDWSIPLNNDHLEGLVGSLASIMVQAVLSEKRLFNEDLQERERQGLHDPEKGDTPEIRAQREALQQKLDEVTRYAISEPRDFHSTLAILTLTRDEGEPKLVLLAGEKALQQIDACRQGVLDNEEPLRELRKLNEEKFKQLAQRSSLPEQEQLRLLELQFQQDLLLVRPPSLQLSLSQYQSTISETLSKMLQVAYRTKEVEEKLLNDLVNAPRLVRGASLTSAQIEERSKKGLELLEADIDRVITLCTRYLTELREAHRFVQLLNNQYRDFKRLLVLGAYTQQILKAQLEIQERYEALTKKKLELEQKQISGAPPSEELLDVLSDLEELAPKINEPSVTLRSWILDVAELMIDSARIEKQEHIVLEQIVLVFKMKMTVDKFEEVKNLTAPKDWPTVRKELLDYVARHDTTLPGSPISLKEQLELLLREGLCDESIKIFPEPETNDYINSQRIEILELLWFEVDRQQPKELDRILPMIEKYAKKEYQQFKITTLDRLFDIVQLKFPDFMKTVYSRGSEILIGNLPATKYNVYCQFLKALKKRLTIDLKVPAEWDTFIRDVRKEHGRKKKLIQMLNIEEL